jgi:hypothetical protein
MSEKEIRAILREAFAELDRRAGRAVKKVVLPTMVGAGLALGAGGCGHRAVPGPAQDGSVMEASARQGDAQQQQGDAQQQRQDFGYPVPPYSAPQVDQGVAPPPTPDYMAPMYGSPFPEPDGGQ